MYLSEILTTKPAHERARLKGIEIAKIKKIPRQNVKFSGADYDIEIVDTKSIQTGVEIFARAWHPNGEQVGFGKDGSIDLERFRIFNPPILVDDPNGTIIRPYKDAVTNEPRERKLREDPKEAILQSLAHTISLVGKDGANIVKGKVGNTTSTFYPDPDVESTSVDGPVCMDTDPGGSWAAAHDATVASGSLGGAFPSVSESTDTNNGIGCYNSSNGRHIIARGFFLFDTSALGDTDTIDSVTSSIYVVSINDADNDANAFVSVVQSTPAGNTDLVAEDYDQCGAVSNPTEGIDTGERKDITNITAAAYLNFTLNSTGRGWISKTGITKLGIREGHDILNDPLTNNGGNTHESIFIRWADYAGTTNDPKLVVVHSVAAVLSTIPTLLTLGVG